MGDTLADLERYVAGLDNEQKAELDAMLGPELEAVWLPEPDNEPQVLAYYSAADLLLYGGGAGGGKTDLIVGLALTEHTRTVIFRAQRTDLRGIEERILELVGRDGWNGQDKIMRRDGRVLELGHLDKPGAELTWQGRPHDLVAFDEGAQLAREKVQFVLGWLRSVDPKQRRRAVIASNPPTGGEGEWLIDWFAPWLDPRYPRPAARGELRWAATGPDRQGTTIWLPDGSPIIFTGDLEYRKATPEEIEGGKANCIEPLTRTFIPALLDDNPYLAKTGYRARLQALPEPLRSQLLKGDFQAARRDHEWQVIPTAWVKAAQERWTPEPPAGARMSAIGVDVAQGGEDDTVLAPRYGAWYAPLVVHPGHETPKPSDVAGIVVSTRRNNAVPVVDMGGGYGGGVKERLDENGVKVWPFHASGDSRARTKDGQLGFYNRRAEATWKFREALDPDQEHGSAVALPPDPQLLAELTALRWKLGARGIQVESKEELKKPHRLGRSPDRGDAVIIAWSEGDKAIAQAMRAEKRSTQQSSQAGFGPNDRGTGWMR